MEKKLLGIIAIVCALFSIVFVFGCVTQGIPFISTVQKANDSGATPEGVNAVANANNQFALELYSQIKGDKDNVFFSPYSISDALAMTYEGAKGQTASEMQSVFHFPNDSSIRHSSFASLYNLINGNNKYYTLKTANALWVQVDYSLLKNYTDTVKDYYGGNTKNLDFVKDTEGSRKTINTWIEDQTNDKIKDMIPQGVLNSLTRLVLTNAIYFKGTWLKQFNKDDTHEQDFRISPDSTVKAQMMQLTGENASFNYAETDSLQMLELPYSGENISMVILLPKNDSITALESSLTLSNLNKWENNLVKQRVNVFIPKFKFETKYDTMADTLSSMGMPTAFTGNADFSGMNGNGGLQITAVLHHAFVEVNEEGTEAAAATVVVVGLTAVPVQHPIPVFLADHPFIFIIKEKSTGSILFMGKVVDPTVT